MFLAKCRPLGDGRWALSSPYDERLVELAHQLPGLRFDRKSRTWVGFADSMGLLANRLHTEKLSKVAGFSPREPLTVLDHWKSAELRDYQKIGVSFLESAASEGSILADDMGLGKTRQTLTALTRLCLPAVVVCPAIIKNEWVKEGAKLNIDVLPLAGVKPPEGASLKESDGIVVVNYDVVHAWLPLLREAKTVVFDEAHALINEKSRRSKACRELANGATNKIALSGTPFQNRPIQLWNVVDTISPGRFGHYIAYAKRYCDAFQEEVPKRKGEIQEGAEEDKKKVWNVKGSSHTDELNERLKQFMLRRLKSEVALELPPMTRQTIELECPIQKDTTSNIPTDLDDGWMRWALSVTARAKIKSAVELAINHLANGSSIVVTSHRHEIANEIRAEFAKAGVDVFMATGEQTVARRMKSIEEASRNTPCIVVTTTHAVGEGINTLTFADVAIICELDYVPRWIKQFEARLVRPGQRRNVLIQYLIQLGSVDEIVRDRILQKIKVIDAVVGKSDDALDTDLGGSALNEEALLAELRDALLAMK